MQNNVLNSEEPAALSSLNRCTKIPVIVLKPEVVQPYLTLSLPVWPANKAAETISAAIWGLIRSSAAPRKTQ